MSETLELTLGSDLFEARLLHSRVVAAGFDAQLVATFKQIRLVEFIPEIPKSASGKILRRELRDR